ncbi:MAG: hypothetical protein P8Y95_14845, partial [Gammaproteobacteria bacterium]
MEGESILETIAEISVAFAGFTGVVAAFGRGSAAPWTLGDRLRFRVMLSTSLAALLFALLPFILFHLGVRGESLWTLSSVFLAAYLLGSAIVDMRVYRTRRTSNSSDSPSRLVAIVVGSLGFGAMVMQCLNAL